jgi:chromosome segregation ATPase
MSNKEFAEMAEIYKGYKALVDAAGIDYDENDMERYLRALINKCVNYGFQEANTSLDAIQRRTTRLENDLTKAREVFKETSKEAEKFKSQLQSIRYQEKSYFEEQCQQISKENKPSSGVNPFHDAVDDFLNQLDEHSFPSEAKGEALSAFINSMGYLYWQNNATDKQKEKEPPTLRARRTF